MHRLQGTDAGFERKPQYSHYRIIGKGRNGSMGLGISNTSARDAYTLYLGADSLWRAKVSNLGSLFYSEAELEWIQ